MDAIVTAGGIPQPNDPLYTYSHGDSKALIDIAGKPMVQWVLDALGDAQKVDNVIIVGLSPKSGVTCKKPTYFISNQGRMIANIVVGVNKVLELNKKSQYVLLVSSDIPAVKSEMVDWLIDTCMETKDEMYYGICPREVMEQRFPNSKRTFNKLKDMELCSADMHVGHVRMAMDLTPKQLELWEALLGSRKNALKQASMLGWDTAFLWATHSITLEDLVAKACKRLGVKGRVIIWDHAEPCMDVDKPHQLELMRMDLAKQRRRSVARARSAAKKTEKKPARSKPTKKESAAAKRTSAARTKTKVKAGK